MTYLKGHLSENCTDFIWEVVVMSVAIERLQLCICCEWYLSLHVIKFVLIFFFSFSRWSLAELFSAQTGKKSGIKRRNANRQMAWNLRSGKIRLRTLCTYHPKTNSTVSRYDINKCVSFVMFSLVHFHIFRSLKNRTLHRWFTLGDNWHWRHLILRIVSITI